MNDGSMALPRSPKRPTKLRQSLGTIYTAGRPPWYNIKGETQRAFVIGIAGGSASGKTTVANKILDELGVRWVCLLSQDSFYKVLNDAELKLAHNNDFDFDHPDSIDMELLIDSLKRLKQGEQVDIPIYDFGTHSRADDSVSMYGASVIIFEGLFALQNEKLRSLLDVKVFVDEDADVRLARRLKRDISERNREMTGVLKQYGRFVKPSFDQHIQPTMKYADLVIPRGASNTVAMHLLITEVKNQLKRRGFNIRKELMLRGLTCKDVPDAVEIVPQTNQLLSYHTTICNRETTREDFVFYAERMMRTLLEFAVSRLNWATTETSIGNATYPCKGLAKPIVGVSILRSGVAMEPILSEIVQGVTIGRLLITTNSETMEPELHHCSIPDLRDRTIILMDPTMATGAAAMMAVRVLLDHGAMQEDICISTLLTTRTGMHSVSNAFPKVKIITTNGDHKLDDKLHLLPGIGNFGDRFFGTTTNHENDSVVS